MSDESRASSRSPLTFTVVLIRDFESGGYTVHVPGLPGCITDGETIESALVNAQDAIACYLHDEDVDALVARQQGDFMVVAHVRVER
jgi:predicted RNase H-like HicB family nuclease